jgi:hypothetical protein
LAALHKITYDNGNTISLSTSCLTVASEEDNSSAAIGIGAGIGSTAVVVGLLIVYIYIYKRYRFRKPGINIQLYIDLNIYSGTCAIRHLSFPTSCDNRHKSMVPKVFLSTKIKPEFPDILHNPTYFPSSILYRIRQVTLYMSELTKQ